MTAGIARLPGTEAFDLIYPQYLAMLGTIEQETMRRSMANSGSVWVGYEDDKVIGFWGLIAPTLLSDRAYLWLYTTEHLHDHVFLFIRHSQRAMQEMLTLYPLIVGHCALSATKSIRWLRWLGAEFGQPVGALLPFEIRAKQ